MNHTARNLATALGLVFALSTVVVSGKAQQSQHTFQIANYSAYDIREIYVSSPNSPYWGPDRLGDYVLHTNQMLPVSVGRTFDVKLVDEDGDQCIRRFTTDSSATWDVTTDVLLGCEFQ